MRPGCAARYAAQARPPREWSPFGAGPVGAGPVGMRFNSGQGRVGCMGTARRPPARPMRACPRRPCPAPLPRAPAQRHYAAPLPRSLAPRPRAPRACPGPGRHGGVCHGLSAVLPAHGSEPVLPCLSLSPAPVRWRLSDCACPTDPVCRSRSVRKGHAGRAHPPRDRAQPGPARPGRYPGQGVCVRGPSCAPGLCAPPPVVGVPSGGGRGAGGGPVSCSRPCAPVLRARSCVPSRARRVRGCGAGAGGPCAGAGAAPSGRA